MLLSILVILCLGGFFSSTYAVSSEVLGDINGDGKTTLLDVRLAIQKVIGESYTTNEMKLLDYNKDGKVSLLDVRLLLLDVVHSDHDVSILIW